MADEKFQNWQGTLHQKVNSMGVGPLFKTSVPTIESSPQEVLMYLSDQRINDVQFIRKFWTRERENTERDNVKLQ